MSVIGSPMHLAGSNQLESLMNGQVHDLKMVFNANDVILFPSSRQHREMKGEGISYEDNYAGNALAAMVRRDAIEIRYHKQFTDAAVGGIMRLLLSQPQLEPLRGVAVTYQGRVIAI